MHRDTGKSMELKSHIVQSIQDILMTPLGSRVMRREYGSLLPRLVDKPSNDEMIMQLMAATVIAIAKWETRISLAAVDITPISMNGRLGIVIDAIVIATGERAQLKLDLFGQIIQTPEELL